MRELIPSTGPIPKDGLCLAHSQLHKSQESRKITDPVRQTLLSLQPTKTFMHKRPER